MNNENAYKVQRLANLIDVALITLGKTITYKDKPRFNGKQELYVVEIAKLFQDSVIPELNTFLTAEHHNRPKTEVKAQEINSRRLEALLNQSSLNRWQDTKRGLRYAIQALKIESKGCL